MKIIVNASTLIGSGVTQVAVSFLSECNEDDSNNEYFVFLGKEVAKSINQEDFDDRFTFFLINEKPLPIMGKGFDSLKLMKKLEKKIKPDVVFSVFGPSWWTPKVPHLQGYAYPHYIFPESPFFKLISKKEKFKIFLSKWLHLTFLKRNGKFFVTETEFVSKRLEKLLNDKKSEIFTVSNTCNSFFRNFKNDNKVTYLPENRTGEFRFISLCTMQEHKNLKILNKVIPLLIQKGYSNVKFVLTIDQKLFEISFSNEVKNNIINVGRIPPEDCPYLFNECDALFLPTLLECFSANYPEAMFLKKPILTSDLAFSKDICREAAFYFNPLDENSIVAQMEEVMNSDLKKSQIVNKGLENLNRFKTPKERAINYLQILEKIKHE